MSNLTTAYDTILEALATLYPDKTRIPNPYSLEDNSILFLRDGYGVKIGSTEIEDGEFQNYRYGLGFSVVLTLEVLKTDENTTAIEDATKALFEDLNTVRKDLYNVDQLGIDANIERVDLGSSTGIEFISGEKFNYLNIESSFTVYLQETL